MEQYRSHGSVASSAFWHPDSDSIIEKETITMDQLIENLHLNNVNFIKMDIEGAELNALKGCERVISKFHPRIAIASYHQINGIPTRIEVELKVKKLSIRSRNGFLWKRMYYLCMVSKLKSISDMNYSLF